MSGTRLSSGGLIDRARRIDFNFDGRSMHGFGGDTLASALLANGTGIVGRSFKYHRPRGVWGGWFDEPNAIFSVRTPKGSLPNVLGTTTALAPGMDIRSVNAWPNAGFDVKGGLDLFSPWLKAGFYYKTFMKPDWHLFEPMIRRMAGLGTLEPDMVEGYTADQVHAQCDLLVVGGGAAGLAAAEAAARQGKTVWLVEDHDTLGGGLYRMGDRIEGLQPTDWVAARKAAIEDAGGRILTHTTAFGVFDHRLYGLARQSAVDVAPTLYRLRAKECLLASGAIDRPVTFGNNDLPGIMSLEAGLEYLGRYGVRVGNAIAIAANHAQAASAAARLSEAGAKVSLFDPAKGDLAASGRRGVKALRQGKRAEAVDCVLASAGWTPVLHLWRHAGGKLRWDEALATFLPAEAPAGMRAIGAANGTFDLDQALAEARAFAMGEPYSQATTRFTLTPTLPKPGAKGRQWIDFQHDVTLKDIELAERENYVSVEHLKRYTTLSMASDQGKTSNIPGLAAMAALTGKTIPEVGTTTFRPPFVPVPLALYHGHHGGQNFRPLKRLALENVHRSSGAALGEYGGWLRPAWYGDRPGPEAAQSEARMVRDAGGILDASPLGKIEVMGPDAEAFVNFVYYNTMKTLKPGFLRYGFLLTERGVIFDDGVVFRMGPNRFVISSSSSHAEGVTGMLESWRQDGNDPDRIFVHDTTNHWSTVTVTGPKARDVTRSLGLDVDLSADAFPHMTFRETVWRDVALRIARVSFTGEVSFEISVPASSAKALWTALADAGRPLGVRPMGIEALSILRAEKGFIIIGKDTDGETMPHDLGFTLPRTKKPTTFVGDRGLHTDAANDPDRRQLVGLSAIGDTPLPTGAHLIDGTDRRSFGIVTSSYMSPNVNRPIALGLVERGTQRMGETVTLFHLGQTYQATLTSPVAFDREGARIHA
ncbi:2Fe-2S iron-sulfur cluster-binding protein [Chachezhania antarctica]|uniref:2Fe-2S iron-sulfur cluster-binding protein n=1 Tax=Chachezhania antarctica TaxID=2340860 RepID=UPI000EAE8FB9|nr:2Fe-2S iron-sulfur cluster-binding protein [Chachezhania antarctica]|tara:strand:+ start:3292 stop:6087 length:2796 start_codon:yes stop_codon:yes gene_type:complete